jgi:adenylate cyclase
VLVGVTATAVYDLRVTPLAAAFPGVEIHATIIDNVLQERFLWVPRWADEFEAAAILLFALLVGWFLSHLRAVRAALACLALAFAYAASTEFLLLEHGCLLPVVAPTLAVGLSFAAGTLQRYVWEERERRRLRKALELYLSPSAAAYVAEHPQALRLGGEKRDCTVLFSDVRDFTAISETLPPEQLMELLNVYLGAMTEVVFEHDGMLDKYIGDGLMALWGVPLPQPGHARKACAAALAMQERLRALSGSWHERGWPALAIRVGIHSGPMVFGNLGSAEHLSLTVIGDNVNLASRLEGLNKRYGTTILASEATVAQAGEDLLVREIDWVRVKGRQQPVRVFELLGIGDFPERSRLQERARRFEAGLGHYRQRDWAAAARCFRELLQSFPDDAPAQLFLQRCEQFASEPPPPQWTPITQMEEK